MNPIDEIIRETLDKVTNLLNTEESRSTTEIETDDSAHASSLDYESSVPSTNPSGPKARSRAPPEPRATAKLAGGSFPGGTASIVPVARSHTTLHASTQLLETRTWY